MNRFRHWFTSNPVAGMLIFALVATLVFFYAIYKPLGNGATSFYWWGWEAWDSDNDLEHGAAILPGAIAVAWWHRLDFANAIKRPSWAGLLPLGFGIFLFVAAVWTVQARVALVALPFLIIGCTWCLWGWPVTRLTLFPAFLLFFMVPVGFLLSHTEPLQRLVAGVVTTACNLVGIGIERDGVKLLASDGSFQCEVAGGCSGIRSLMAMIMLSLLYTHFTMKEPWKKLLVFAMTLPFAVLGNIFRVFTIVFFSNLFSDSKSEALKSFGTGTWHNISGFIITIPIAVGAMILFADLLSRDWSGLKKTILTEDKPVPRPSDTIVDAAAGTKGDAPQNPAPSASPISYDY